MKLLKKFAVCAVSLAMASSAAAAAVNAAEVSPAPIVTENRAAVQDVSGKVKNLDVSVSDNGRQISIKDTVSGTSVLYSNGVVIISGTVINKIDLSINDITPGELTIMSAVMSAMQNMSVKVIAFDEDVTQVNFVMFGNTYFEDELIVAFGSKIKKITPDFLKDYNGKLEVHGISNTIAKSFAIEKNGMFIADDIKTYSRGDVNGDKKIDASDASDILIEYARVQTGRTSFLGPAQQSPADVNKDGRVDAIDASRVLAYYGAVQTGKGPLW